MIRSTCPQPMMSRRSAAASSSSYRRDAFPDSLGHGSADGDIAQYAPTPIRVSDAFNRLAVSHLDHFFPIAEDDPGACVRPIYTGDVFDMYGMGLGLPEYPDPLVTARQDSTSVGGTSATWEHGSLDPPRVRREGLRVDPPVTVDDLGGDAEMEDHSGKPSSSPTTPLLVHEYPEEHRDGDAEEVSAPETSVQPDSTLEEPTTATALPGQQLRIPVRTRRGKLIKAAPAPKTAVVPLQSAQKTTRPRRRNGTRRVRGNPRRIRTEVDPVASSSKDRLDNHVSLRHAREESSDPGQGSTKDQDADLTTSGLQPGLRIQYDEDADDHPLRPWECPWSCCTGVLGPDEPFERQTGHPTGWAAYCRLCIDPKTGKWFVFPNREIANDHLEKNHCGMDNEHGNIVIDPSDPDGISFVCPWPGCTTRIGVDTSSMKRHCGAHMRVRELCSEPGCGEFLSNTTALNYHRSNKHPHAKVQHKSPPKKRKRVDDKDGDGKKSGSSRAVRKARST